MARSQKLILHNLRETYHELGLYDFKVVLSPTAFKTAEGMKVRIFDSDGKNMKYDFSIWGRKIFCKFTIDPTVSDGVSFIQIDGDDPKGRQFSERIPFWVIKP